MCNTSGEKFSRPSSRRRSLKLKLLLLRKRWRRQKKNAFHRKEDRNRIIIGEGGETIKVERIYIVHRREIIIVRCPRSGENSSSRKKMLRVYHGYYFTSKTHEGLTNADRNRKTTIPYICIRDTKYLTSNRRFLSRKIITNFTWFPRLLYTLEMGRNSNF